MKIKRAGIITKAVIAAMILYAVISLVDLKAKISQAQQERQELQDQVQEMYQKNAELEYQIEHNNDDDTIESIARDKLGLVKPGEKIFYDMGN